jgi:hypothetical protein
MSLPTFLDDLFEIDVSSTAYPEACVKGTRRFAARFSNFIRFKSTLDHVGYRTVFPSGKPVRKITGLGASYRKLWRRHADLLFQTANIASFDIAIKMAADGKMSSSLSIRLPATDRFADGFTLRGVCAPAR